MREIAPAKKLGWERTGESSPVQATLLIVLISCGCHVEVKRDSVAIQGYEIVIKGKRRDVREFGGRKIKSAMKT